MDASIKQRNQDKLAKIPVKIENNGPSLEKPPWLKIKLINDPNIQAMKDSFKSLNLHTVCQEANCPNLSECYSQGIATFMIMGDKCTRRCAFCDVAHGRPDPLDPNEPKHLAMKIAQMNLKYMLSLLQSTEMIYGTVVLVTSLNVFLKLDNNAVRF